MALLLAGSIAVAPNIAYGATCGDSDVAQLLSKVPISSTSHIYVTGPYQVGGSLMVEDSEIGVSTLTLQIGQPNEAGSFCVYFIDDLLFPGTPPSYHFPTVKFDHPVRYAWTNQNNASEFGVVSANDNATIYPYPLGMQTPRPYVWVQDEVVAGVPVSFGYGEFAPVIRNKPEVAPEVVSDVTVGGCLREALVIDGGDKENWLASGIASAAATDGTNMGNWLSNRTNQFTVTRRSQYSGNKIPAFTKGDERGALFRRLDAFIQTYRGTTVGKDCHHEFFFYFGGHGSSRSWFLLYRTDGSGNPQTVTYTDLVARLNSFPTDAAHKTTVYAMFDACYSGTAIAPARNGFQVPPHWALQVLTATDTTHTAAGGHVIFSDSATEDFLRDPTTMTTGYGEMVKDAWGNNPQRLRAPDRAGVMWFILDP